jgi:hypothetical protein
VAPGRIGRSLTFETSSMPLENMAEVILDIQDDEIALEDPEEAVLKLSIPPQNGCPSINFSPLKTTRILILDNDSKCNDLDLI